MMLTSHVDVSGAAHVSSREDNEIQDVSDDTEATNGRQHDAITDPSQSRRPRILQYIRVLRQQADILNLTHVEHVHHLAAFPRSLQHFSQLAISFPVLPRTLSLNHHPHIPRISFTQVAISLRERSRFLEVFQRRGESTFHTNRI